jgi:magnesium transporter
MTSFTTFFLSRILGRTAYDNSGNAVGIVKDLLIETNYSNQTDERPIVRGIKLKRRQGSITYDFHPFLIEKMKGKLFVTCNELIELSPEQVPNSFFLAEIILDKQIVDLNGRKLVRVNDVRLASASVGTFAIAVDVGFEGLLRRIGIVKPLKFFLSLLYVNMPSRFIIWDDVEAIDFSKMNIKLSKSYAKLHTLHPSDLADIIEEMGKKISTDVFSALDEEKAADVLEELETDAQIHIIESLPVEKVADVLEKMPADEVADILDNLEDEKAESLLNEMESESSQEVRELLEYPENSVGGLMTTEVLFFNEKTTIEEVLSEFRTKKPEADELYNLFVTDEREELLATFSLRDVVVSPPGIAISQIMKTDPVFLYDYQKIDDIAEIISKYNLLAIPVVDKNNQLQGMVVIDDVVEDLINKRRTNK